MPVQIIVFLYDVLSYPVYRFLGKAFTQVTLDEFSALTFLQRSGAVSLTADSVFA